MYFERQIMDQAGIAGMEKDVLKLQIEIMKKQVDLERMNLSESIREYVCHILWKKNQYWWSLMINFNANNKSHSEDKMYKYT